MFCFSSGQSVPIDVHESSAIIGDNQIHKNISAFAQRMDVMKLYGMCKLIPTTMLCENLIASVCIQFKAKTHVLHELQVKLIRFRNKNVQGQIELPPNETFTPDILASLEFTFDESLATFYDQRTKYRNSWKSTKATAVKVLLKQGDLIGIMASFENIELAAFSLNATVS